MRYMRVLALPMLALSCGAQAPPEATFEGRPGWLLANDRLEMIVLAQGGSIVSLVLRDDPARVNPLWNPVRMAREAGQTPPGGSGMGHFLCLDGFGAPSPEEQAAGLSFHGEAVRLPWALLGGEPQGAVRTLTLSVKLPLVQEVLTRIWRLAEGENVVQVTSRLESLTAFDRPICWAEHATIGSPFLKPVSTVVDMSAQRGKTRRHPPRPGRVPRRLASFEDFTWPMAPGTDGRPVDLRAAPANPNSSDHTTCLLDPERQLAYVTALDLETHLLLGYLFRREDFPWLQNWESYPGEGRLARGLEFSTQPFDVPRREAVAMSPLLGAPTFRWLPARTVIETRFLMFWARAPEGMKRVDEVRLQGGRLLIEDRQAARRLILACSLGL